MVVDADLVADSTCRVLDAVEVLAMNALLLQRPEHTVDHAVLLRALWCAELLPQTAS